MNPISRRTALQLVGGAALTGGLQLTAGPTWSAAGAQAAGYYRTTVGDLAVTTLYDGQLRRPVTDGLVRNASVADVERALADALLPTDHIDNPYTFTAVESDGQLILIDVGTGDLFDPSIDNGERAMAAAGIDPAQVDLVILTHFHPDHVGGLTTTAGAPAFPNADVLFPKTEHDFIHDDTASGLAGLPQMMQDFAGAAREKLAPYGAAVRLYEDGETLARGITALATPGHTPGHMAIVLEDGGETLIIVGDAATYPALFIANPGWHVMFDGDGPRAEETRRRLLSGAADSGARIVGTHFPFPSIGRVAATTGGFRYVPERWTLTP